MITLSRSSPYALVLAFLLPGALAHAAPPATAPASTATPAAAGSGNFLDELGLRTPQQKVEYANKAIEEIRAVKAAIEDLQKSAPECVEGRLVLVNALIEASVRAQGEMQRFALAGEQARSDAELRKIAIALSVAQRLLAEATGCTEQGGASGDMVTSYAYFGMEPEEVADILGLDFVTDDPPEKSPFQ